MDERIALGVLSLGPVGSLSRRCRRFRRGSGFSGLKPPQGSKKGVRPGGPGPERPVRGGYFFLAAADLAATAAFLEASALLALDCFCEDFFWFAFGDLSPMVICRMEVC